VILTCGEFRGDDRRHLFAQRMFNEQVVVRRGMLRCARSRTRWLRAVHEDKRRGS